MRSAFLVGLSHRRALIETAGQLALRANIILRLDAEANGSELQDLYAKVIRLSDESHNRYIVLFTSVSDGMRVAVTAACKQARQPVALRRLARHNY